MKNKLLILTFLFISFSISSCKTDEVSDVKSKKISLNIEGMTCEIGCARTIQAKLAKTEGVNYVNINFDEKSGTVTYNPKAISEKQIVQVVEQIAGGELYKVTEVLPTE